MSASHPRQGLPPLPPPPVLQQWLWPEVRSVLLGLLLVLVMVSPLPVPLVTGIPGALGPGPEAAWAGPVDWREVPASDQGRQWWDAGSLRRDRRGTLSVLSRFQPAEGPENALGTLLVMDLDCADGRIRDRSINGLPQWKAAWTSVAADPLMAAVLHQACAAADPAPPTHG
jgi:hypothetical protein